VCVERLTTTSTIEFGDYSQDIIEINGKPATGEEAQRVHAVVSPLKNRARNKAHYRLLSINSLSEGKGLGFSASAFAAISLATCAALNLKMRPERLSEIARLGAGSATRSLMGGFSIWYANKNGRSYSKQLRSPTGIGFAMAIVPIRSSIKTDLAHEESVGSPFFQARVKEAGTSLRKMRRAIQKRDIDEIGRLAEADTLKLHAITMTGRSGIILMVPETLNIIEKVKAMREIDHIPVWYSLDTGPSVYINTHQEHIDEVCREIQTSTSLEVIKSGIGGPAHIIQQHLF
jgi:diphosphomevalonate decarboxylase